MFMQPALLLFALFVYVSPVTDHTP